MAGKYAHVVQGLPKYLGEDPERTTLLNKLRDEIEATPIDDEADYNLSAQLTAALRPINAMVGEVLSLAKKCPGAQTASGAARSYADARFVLDAITEWKASAQLLVDVYERMMTDRMEAEGIASLKLSTGASISTYAEPYGKVVDREAFRLWCIANGYETELRLWPSSTASIVRERALAGTRQPNGVEVTAKTQVRMSKA